MRARLAILAISVMVAIGLAGQPDCAAQHKKNNAAQIESPEVPPESVELKPGTAGYKPQAGVSSPNEDAPVERAEVLGLDSNWWLVIIAGLTGIVVCWQSWATAKAARGANRAADANLQQIELTRDRERARLIVEPIHLEIESPEPGRPKKEWNIRATVKVSNIGSSRAFDIRGRASLWVQDSSSPTKPRLLLPWQDTPDFRVSADIGNYLVHLDSQIVPLTLNQFEAGISCGKQDIFLQGFVEYETLGIKYRRDYGWRWWYHGEGKPLNSVMVGMWSEDDTQKNGEYRQNPK